MVRQRAGDRCEYCRIPQSLVPDISFHVEHIVALQHGGSDEADNLALACDRCNCYKGPNLTAIDPLTNEVTRLFHPRQDRWHAHFGQTNFEMIGLSGVGRATVRLLNMNDSRRVQLRIVANLDLTID